MGTSLVKMSGAQSFTTLEVELNYKLYQRTDHLEPADYADLEVITGDDGVQYVERDLNYTIDSVKVRMSETGDIAAHFGVAGSNDNILCAIGTYNGLVLGLKPLVQPIGCARGFYFSKMKTCLLLMH